MKKEDLKTFIVPTAYIISILLLVLSIALVQNSLKSLKAGDDNFEYGIDNVFDGDEIPTMSPGEEGEIILGRPYTDASVKLLKSFYDYKGEAKNQENSLIFYENTYMQNSGSDYSGKENFEIVSILDGIVTNVSEDNILGKVIEIKHNNELISVYQSLSEISVKKDDEVKKGQVIGKSGTSNIDKNAKDHLHFELYYKGQVVDPEGFFDKKLSEL